MAYEVPILDFTFVAAADLSGDQYRFVTLDANAQIDVSAAGANAIGVLQNKPTAGQAATVRVAGITQIILGGTVASGGLVEIDANGEAIAQSAASCMGIMLQGGADGEVGSMLIDRSFAAF